MDMNIEELKVTGMEINYYYICKRKLWLFSKGITMEENSERVISGQILHENSFNNEKSKEVLIDNLIKIDVIDKKTIKEIKSSSKMKLSDSMQVYYYLWYLEQIGIHKTGEINYIKEKKKVRLELNDNIRNEIVDTMKDINKIKSLEKSPSIVKNRICTKCAYHNLCFIGEI